MIPTAHLPVGIYTEDCLAWSIDGELAIAAGEEVYLLIPRPGASEPWTHIRIRVNAFTHEEWPPKLPESFAEMSIGEEQARVTIASLAWSPYGIGKHGRSVLAVLTTNLLLSVWSPGGDPITVGSWQRVLIINETRVRAMSWVPVGILSAKSQTSLIMKKRENCLLAVTDDRNGVSFFLVSSPFVPNSSSWNFQRIGHESIPPIVKTNWRYSLLQIDLDSKHFIDYIAFGEFNADNTIQCVYRSAGLFYQTTLSISIDPLRAIFEATPHQPVAQGDHDKELETPSHMQDLMQQHLKQYADTKRLTLDRVFLKTWGTASLGNLTAMCVTSHPAKMIEYYAIVHSSATILFGHTPEADAEQAVFPWQVPREVDEGKTCQKILQALFDRQVLADSSLTTLDLKIIYAAICATFFHPMSEPQRLSCLTAAENAVKIIETKLGTNLEAEHEVIDTLKIDGGTMSKTSSHSLIEASENPTEQKAKLLDSCPICEDSLVGLTGAEVDFLAAYCTNGHPFCTYSFYLLELAELRVMPKPGVL